MESRDTDDSSTTSLGNAILRITISAKSDTIESRFKHGIYAKELGVSIGVVRGISETWNSIS